MHLIFSRYPGIFPPQQQVPSPQKVESDVRVDSEVPPDPNTTLATLMPCGQLKSRQKGVKLCYFGPFLALNFQTLSMRKKMGTFCTIPKLVCV